MWICIECRYVLLYSGQSLKYHTYHVYKSRSQVVLQVGTLQFPDFSRLDGVLGKLLNLWKSSLCNIVKDMCWTKFSEVRIALSAKANTALKTLYVTILCDTCGYFQKEAWPGLFSTWICDRVFNQYIQPIISSGNSVNALLTHKYHCLYTKFKLPVL